jgi:hypothetical protein
MSEQFIGVANQSLDRASLPKSLPAAVVHPYDPNDMDGAVAYAQRTNALFAKGDHDQAYTLYMRDPNGGAQADFNQTTKNQFVSRMYNTRDVHGKPVYPQPEGYQQAGFIVGHEAHLRNSNSWAKIWHVFEFESKPYVMLEFEQPVSTFTDAEVCLQVSRGVTASQRKTQMMVTADQIDGIRSPTPVIEDDDTAPELSDAQRAAMVAFRDDNGRDWKHKLGVLWTTGNYVRRGIDKDQAAQLQQVRNQFGPEWLANVKCSDLDAPDDADLCSQRM